MKKICCSLALILVFALSLCACSVTGSTNAKPLTQIFNDIKSQVKITDMNELTSEESLNRYYGIEEKDVSEFAGGINNTGVDQEEIVLIKATNKDAAERVKTALESRYQAKINENKSYNPKQAKMIEKCSVEQNDLYVTMIISENAEEITKIYNDDMQ